MEQQMQLARMCISHPRHRGAGIHVDKPSGATSELTVSDCVGDRLGKVYGRMRHHHGYKRGMADASTSRVRARRLVLRLVFGPLGQAP